MRSLGQNPTEAELQGKVGCVKNSFEFSFYILDMKRMLYGKTDLDYL